MARVSGEWRRYEEEEVREEGGMDGWRDRDREGGLWEQETLWVKVTVAIGKSGGGVSDRSRGERGLWERRRGGVLGGEGETLTRGVCCVLGGV